VTLANDCILREALHGEPVDLNETTAAWLRISLSVLEYVEVLFEALAHRLWGEPGKWFVVCVIQVCRSDFAKTKRCFLS
jgi:hypothetical protein